MNRTTIPWVQNPDGSPGWTWNPITGCLNHVDGMCKGGNFHCWAHGLANGRLRSRYLANKNIALQDVRKVGMFRGSDGEYLAHKDPFYLRFWPEKLKELSPKPLCEPSVWRNFKAKGIFACDMSDLFGIGVPEDWTRQVLEVIEGNPYHRFYLLTKQPQNLVKFTSGSYSRFPANCWVGATVTNDSMMPATAAAFDAIWTPVRYISFEPLLDRLSKQSLQEIRDCICQWVIIGAQTKPYKAPEIEWVKELVEAADKASIPVFLKDNLRWPRLSADGATPFYKRTPSGTMQLRQEMPSAS